MRPGCGGWSRPRCDPVPDSRARSRNIRFDIRNIFALTAFTFAICTNSVSRSVGGKTRVSEQTIFDVFRHRRRINGCGIARDAAGRGYSVALAEMSDFASGTSSGSTKLIHGGLRYLEHYEFRLVREALMEPRSPLGDGAARHLADALRAALPQGWSRPAWLIRLGLFLYDHIGGRKLLPATKTLDMTRDPAGAPLKRLFTKAFEIFGRLVDDARLVVLNARDAADRGARIMARTPRRLGAPVRAPLAIENRECSDRRARDDTRPHARHAAGPWVDRVLSEAVGNNDVRNVRLVQGSHIVVRKVRRSARLFLPEPGRADHVRHSLPGRVHADRNHRSRFHGNPDDVRISDAQRSIIFCEAASEFSATRVGQRGISCGPIPPCAPFSMTARAKAQEATRDYVLRVENAMHPAQRLRRQAHHLQAACGIGAREDRRDHRGKGQEVDGRIAASGGRFFRPAAMTTSREAQDALSFLAASTPAGWYGSTARGRRSFSANARARPSSKALRGGSLCGGSGLADRPGMGIARGGRALAPHETGTEVFAGATAELEEYMRGAGQRGRLRYHG
ncbi:FAD-dependent oxidoreductase [Sinorhizobium meliloti]|nr:FAD-dependent oxidoreductase [Sinorhizobium meliloti]